MREVFLKTYDFDLISLKQFFYIFKLNFILSQ